MTTAAFSRGDEPNRNPVTTDEAVRSLLINEIHWGAVFAGAVLALAVQLILNMLGVALGGSLFSPVSNENPSATSFSVGAGVWWAVSGIVAAFVGGVAAGRLAGAPTETTGAWHGLSSWAITTLVIFYLVGSTAGSIVGSTVQALGSTMGGVAQSAGGAIRSAAETANPFTSIEHSIRNGSGQDFSAIQNAAVTAMRELVTGDPAQANAARERAAEALAKVRQIPVDQARGQVQDFEQQYRQAADKAKQQAAAAAETTRKAVSQAALWASLALIVGAIAAWFGGWAGSRLHPAITGGANPQHIGSRAGPDFR